MKKSFPVITTDKEAEALLAKDLSDYITPENFYPARFEFLPKTEKVNLRIAAPLLAEIKKRAKKMKMPYQRYIRQLLERDLMHK